MTARLLPRPGSEPVRDERRPGVPPIPALLFVLLLGICYAGLFTWLSLARHGAFQSHAFDLGNMDQAVWNTLHGNPLRFTDMAVGGTVLTNRLAIHVEPFLLLLAPLYLLHAGPETLLVVQACVVAIGVVPAYLLGFSAIRRPYAALAFPLAYALHPSLQNAVLDDFHAVTLSSTFLLFALYFAYRSSVGPFAVSASLAAACKEEVGLLVALLGLVLLWRRRPLAASASAVLGVGWFLFCVLVVVPHFNPTGQSPYLARYAYLGHGIRGVIAGAVAHPGLVVRVLVSPSRRAYLDDLLHPLGYAAIAGWPLLLLASPALLINMLSADPTMYSAFYQYSAEVVPYVIAAAALGGALLRRTVTGTPQARHAALPFLYCCLIVVASLVDCYRYGFTPLSDGFIVPSAGAHQAREAALLRLIPRGVVVAAADEIEPHLSDRHTIYLLPTLHPTNGSAAQYVVLDASVPAEPTEPRTLHALAKRALRSGYGVIGADDGVLVLRRGATPRDLPRRFFTFALSAPIHATPARAVAGGVRLLGYTIHPRSSRLTRSRPAVSVETWWQSSSTLRHWHVTLEVSPVYRGAVPAHGTWRSVTDSPTLDWLPPSRWPVHQPIHVAFLPYAVSPTAYGRVALALNVQDARGSRWIGLGSVRVGY